MSCYHLNFIREAGAGGDLGILLSSQTENSSCLLILRSDGLGLGSHSTFWPWISSPLSCPSMMVWVFCCNSCASRKSLASCMRWALPCLISHCCFLSSGSHPSAPLLLEPVLSASHQSILGIMKAEPSSPYFKACFTLRTPRKPLLPIWELLPSRDWGGVKPSLGFHCTLASEFPSLVCSTQPLSRAVAAIGHCCFIISKIFLRYFNVF